MKAIDVPYSEFIQEVEKFVRAAQDDLIEVMLIGFDNTRLNCTLHRTPAGGRRRRMTKRLDDRLASTALSFLSDSKSEIVTLKWRVGAEDGEIVFARRGGIMGKIERKDGVTTRFTFD